MNNAGRIGFVIKGDYNSTATYDFLDVVYFGNASYVAKKLTIGNEPENNSEYWQILATSPDNAVIGIKGAAESAFRSGNVILTPENIGALPISGGTITGNLNISGQLRATDGFHGDADTVDGKHASYLLNYNNLTNKPKYVTDIFFSGNKYSVNYSDGTCKEAALDFNIGTSTGMLTQVISNGDIYYYVTIGESLVINKEYQVTRASDYTTQVKAIDPITHEFVQGKDGISGDIYIGEKLNQPKLVIKNGSGASETRTITVANHTAKDMWIPKTFNFTYNGSDIAVTNITY